ncbi:MAG: hypothetical protein HQK76_19685 [Desulfobacterales bacterium]|nr:hypothetical protein [Desulfobacterales bacterium]
MGYSVGKNGHIKSERRRILRNVYNNVIPKVFPPRYINEWGRPSSSKRLQKIAESIAAFCRNNKKKIHPPIQAIKDWESDLAWLKLEFYDNRYKFRWPSIDIW